MKESPAQAGMQVISPSPNGDGDIYIQSGN
jgi:hypothetical protein